MTETKTVLGRVFTREGTGLTCPLLRERSLWLEKDVNNPGMQLAMLVDAVTSVIIEYERGPTEADAIRALQATLRKMAELEVAGD